MVGIAHSLLKDAAHIFNVASSEQAATASDFSNIQLFNPATSGKNVLVDGVMVSVDDPDTVRWGLTETELDGTAGVIKTNRGGAYGGDVEITAEADSPTATTYLAAADTLGRVSAGDEGTPLWSQGKFVILPPGFGLTIVKQTVNEALYATFTFSELDE